MTPYSYLVLLTGDTGAKLATVAQCQDKQGAKKSQLEQLRKYLEKKALQSVMLDRHSHNKALTKLLWEELNIEHKICKTNI